MTFIKDKRVFGAAVFLNNTLPTYAYTKIAKLPLIGGPIMKKNAEKLMKINQKTKVLGDLFTHFTRHTWVYESLKIPEYVKQMTP